MHKINIEYNETLNLVVLSCPEGCKITSWNEGDGIMDYSSFTVAYCPANTDASIYRCISDEQDAEYIEKQMIEIEKGAV